jgi:hypothetical protein
MADRNKRPRHAEKQASGSETRVPQEGAALRTNIHLVGGLIATTTLAAFLVAPGATLASGADQRTFATPDAAISALIAALKARAADQVYTILGPELKDFITTRDQAQNEIDRQQFLDGSRILKLEKQKNDPDTVIVYLGESEWPFPAPLVKTKSGWKFEGRAALREIRDRQIGRNEYATIAACEAYVDAQLDYFSIDRRGDGYLQFAQKINSTSGNFDGLYWSNASGEDVSPIGPFEAQAAGVEATEQVPLSGYYFKILTAQGDSAVGGARTYLVKDRMITGFALVAWPAEYRVTGVMTMIVNQLGMVYQADLGLDTPQTARAMTEFNPDSIWTRIE